MVLQKLIMNSLGLGGLARQLSKIQFLCPRIDAKQLIVVNMLLCSGVPGGGTFASKHSCNELVLRRVQGENNFVVTPFHQNRAPRRVLGWSNSVGLRNACATPPKAPLARSHLAAFIRTNFVFFPISTLGLAVTTYNGTSKVHYGQFRRTGRQLS